MPYVSPGGPGDSNTITYPVDLMRSVGLKVMQRAQQAMDDHQRLWSAIEEWIGTCAPRDALYTHNHYDIYDLDVRPYLHSVLGPHAQRLWDAYQWQMNIGQALIDAAEQMSNLDQQIASSYGTVDTSGNKPTGHGSNHTVE
jgi:hypothetical protein